MRIRGSERALCLAPHLAVVGVALMTRRTAGGAKRRESPSFGAYADLWLESRKTKGRELRLLRGEVSASALADSVAV
jgi:hypothetical protein